MFARPQPAAACAARVAAAAPEQVSRREPGEAIAGWRVGVIAWQRSKAYFAPGRDLGREVPPG
jgi:hypothetical protein